MNEQHSTEWKDESEELSADDLAVLQAFEERDTWSTGPLPQHSTSSPTPYEETPPGNPDDDLDDMLMIFASEIDEDIARLRHALSQLEQDDTLDLARFTPIRRIAHKIRGTAGSVDYTVIEAIGSLMEEMVDQTLQHRLFPLIAISVLVQAVHALERTLESLIDSGHERPDALTELENDLIQLNITYKGSPSIPAASATLPATVSHDAPTNPSLTSVSVSIPHIPHRPVPLPAPSLTSLRVDEGRFQQLIQGSEYLVEQRTPLENARIQLQDALQELHHAQAGLQLQAFALDKLTSNTGHALTANPQIDRSISSLIARVLDHEAQHKSPSSGSSSPEYAHVRPPLHRTKPRLVKIDGAWDALKVTRYTDLDETLRAISEAISSVSTASAHVQASYNHFNTTLQKYISYAASVRKNALLLRLTPVSILAAHLRQVIESSKSPQAQRHFVFEVTGEKTELDSTILEELTQPLVSFLQTCLADILVDTEKSVDDTQRIWLHVHCIGNEVVIELGFSMTVQGGALEMLQDTVQRVSGTLTLQRNTHNGVSFLLHVPRTQGTVRGLLLQVGAQQVIVPFSQVQRIDDEKHAALDITYYLHRLLDIPNEAPTKQHTMPLLVLPKGTSRLVAGVLVHEVITDVEVVVKPLPGYLQRPGIVGAGVDGKGNVQLVLNLQELIRHYNTSLRYMLPEQDTKDTRNTNNTNKATLRVLVADDSLVMRQSLLQTLQRAHYETVEAIDGMQALEQLTRNPPDVFLLDMEMPNLSGYDVLSIMHLYHELNDVKVIMLTSRSSEEHKRHALELGAHAYLTKPCPDNVLLETITKLVG